MKMRKYTQEDIDNILNHFDPEIPQHRTAIQDIVLIWNIEQITPSQYDIDTSKLMDKTDDLSLYLRYKIDDPTEYGMENGKFNTVLKLIKFIREENKLQGIATGDFERNIWRLAYVFKSTQFAEELAIQGKEVPRPIDLVENFKDEDISNFNSTYNRLTTHYKNTQSLIGYLRLLLEKSEIKDLQRFIDKLELDLDLVDILENEADATQEYIVNHLKKNVKQKLMNTPAEQLDLKAEMVMDDFFKKFKPILQVPDLKRIKLTDSAYLKMHDKYKDLTVKDLLERKNEIQNDFRDVLYDEHEK